MCVRAWVVRACVCITRTEQAGACVSVQCGGLLRNSSCGREAALAAAAAHHRDTQEVTDLLSWMSCPGRR